MCLCSKPPSLVGPVCSKPFWPCHPRWLCCCAKPYVNAQNQVGICHLIMFLVLENFPELHSALPLSSQTTPYTILAVVAGTLSKWRLNFNHESPHQESCDLVPGIVEHTINITWCKRYEMCNEANKRLCFPPFSFNWRCLQLQDVRPAHIKYEELDFFMVSNWFS